jgi:hypothetical protein
VIDVSSFDPIEGVTRKNRQKKDRNLSPSIRVQENREGGSVTRTTHLTSHPFLK